MNAPQTRWEHFEHQADIGVRGIGPSKAEAFVQAALALTAIITEPETVIPLQAVDIVCEEPDQELLLVDWLNALIYEIATRRMLFGRFEIQLDGPRLQARAWGEPIQTGKHQPTVEIKGATFTALKVGQDDSGAWVAQCVVDV